MIAYVAIGANLGDPAGQIRMAFERLASLSTRPVRKSSLWQTTPVDCPPGSPAFVNAVAALEIQPGETPESLLAVLKNLEQEFGRGAKRVLNEARPLDLDLIAFGDERRNSEVLVLPHPRACVRRFVLEPLCEIAPNLMIPGQTQTVSELLKSLPADSEMQRIGA